MGVLPVFSECVGSDFAHVGDVAARLRESCTNAGIRNGDTTAIELCVVEAANNAIEHAYASEHGHFVTIDVTLVGASLVVAVRDTGRPMRDECLEAAGAMDDANRDVLAERGRGLAIMKAGMDQVSYVSEGGTNTLTMTKRVDVERKTASAQAHQVLLVDDSESILALYGRILSNEGYRVAKAESGAAALRILETMTPDLIVLDSMMPQMSGHQLLEQIRCDPRFVQTPIVFLTASGNDEAAIAHAFELGANDYMIKPVNKRVFAARVKTLLASRRRHDSMLKNKRVASDRDHLLSELKRAQDVQRAQLPKTPSAWGEWRAVGALCPCEQIGGDLFDIVGQTRRTVALIDVSGHGLGAAIAASGARSLLRLLLATLPFEGVLPELNRQLCDADDGHYVCVGLVDVEGDVVRVANAGLPPIVVIDGAGVMQRFEGAGVPPGLVRDAEYAHQTFTTSDDVRIVMTTDGLTEPFGSIADTSSCIDGLGLRGRGPIESDVELENRIRALFESRGLVSSDDATIVVLDRSVQSGS